MNMDKVYFPAYMLDSRTYKVCSGSKYWNTNKTGTSRFKTKEEAQKYCDEINKLNITSWNP